LSTTEQFLSSFDPKTQNFDGCGPDSTDLRYDITANKLSLKQKGECKEAMQ